LANGKKIEITAVRYVKDDDTYDSDMMTFEASTVHDNHRYATAESYSALDRFYELLVHDKEWLTENSFHVNRRITTATTEYEREVKFVPLNTFRHIKITMTLKIMTFTDDRMALFKLRYGDFLFEHGEVIYSIRNVIDSTDS
jgi:hypothetical protein